MFKHVKGIFGNNLFYSTFNIKIYELKHTCVWFINFIWKYAIWKYAKDYKVYEKRMRRVKLNLPI